MQFSLGKNFASASSFSLRRFAPMEYSTLLLILTASFCLLSLPSSALKCWQNSDSTAETDWSIKECNTSNNETACLAQYRLYNGCPLPSFYGCHTPKMRSIYSCNPTEGQDSDYSCSCSSDLCNYFVPHTPDPIPPGMNGQFFNSFQQ